MPVLLLAGLLCTAGCISEQTATTPVDIPSDLAAGLSEMQNDIRAIDASIKADSAELAAYIENAPDHSNLYSVLHEYYADNSWLTGLVFYCSEHDVWHEIPEFNSEIPLTVMLPDEKQLLAEGGYMHTEGVRTPDRGYLNFDYRAVYGKDGTYLGYLIFAYDTYSAIHLHPLVSDEERVYGDFAAYYTSADGEIVYSSVEQTLGETISPNKQFTDGISVLQAGSAASGAYQFSSPAFYLYNRTENTEKIAAWQKTADGHTLYLVKELNRPELLTKNVFLLTTEAALENARDAFLCSVNEGTEAVVKRVNSGYYSTPLVIFDDNGTVIAAADADSIGMNYLNNRGAYGISYLSSAIHTMGHGSGYVYYTLPVDPTVDTPAAEYCIARIIPIDDDLFIFSQFAGDTDLLMRNPDARKDITGAARAVLKEIGETGLSEVIDKINENYQQGGNLFVENSSTDISALSIVGFDGMIYASAQFPQAVGMVQTKTVDVYGGSTTRKAIILAKSGGGIMTCLLPDAAKEGYVDYWVLAIEPIDGTKHICTGSVLATFKDILTPVLEKEI